MARIDSADELTAALEIRREVFVDEQRIPAELDADGLDDSASHVLVLVDGTAAATGRLVEDAGEGVLARIAVRAPYRGRALGELVVRELEQMAAERRLRRLVLKPHRYLERFYERLGYRTEPGTERVGAHELITMTKSIG